MPTPDREQLPAFAGADLKQAALLLALLPVAVLLPERLWRYPCGALAAATSSRFLAHSRRLERYLPPGLAALASVAPSTFLRQQEAGFLEEYVQVLREHTWRWRPDIRLEGREHLAAALAAGNGAILWVTGFESSDLVVKIALRRAGFAVVHLSRPTHGFSSTRFGVRFLNPIRKRAEDRYLGSRVVIEGASAVGAMRALQRHLAANEVVSITVGDAATSAGEVALFGGALAVSLGPANLARVSGAALLPVFLSREPNGEFAVRLGEALAAPGEAAPPARVLQRYGEQLTAAIAARPDQWTGWRSGGWSS